MRPDMLVNVELPVSGPEAIIVPNDAVFDTGLKKTIFVDRGNGFFESREVETGRSLGDRLVITRGLMPGEKIVVSGNFLIDSESRLQQAATGTKGKVSRCSVCGMNVNEDQARMAGNLLETQGKVYYFCSLEDRDLFKKNKDKYLKAYQRGEIYPMTMSMNSEMKSMPPEDMEKPKSPLPSKMKKKDMSMAQPESKSPSSMVESKPKEKPISRDGMPGSSKSSPMAPAGPSPKAKSGDLVPAGSPLAPKPGGEASMTITAPAQNDNAFPKPTPAKTNEGSLISPKGPAETKNGGISPMAPAPQQPKGEGVPGPGASLPPKDDKSLTDHKH